jgi:hypothetical protein
MQLCLILVLCEHEQMFSGLVPFLGVRPEVIPMRVFAGARPPKPTTSPDIGFTDLVWNIMERGWAAEPRDRPDLSDFLEAVSLDLMRLRDLEVGRREALVQAAEENIRRRNDALVAASANLRQKKLELDTREHALERAAAAHQAGSHWPSGYSAQGMDFQVHRPHRAVLFLVPDEICP